MSSLNPSPGQSRLYADGTSDALGNVTITFPPTGLGGTWTGVVSVPMSPVATSWAVMINDKQVATRQGPSEYGPMQISGTDQLVLTSSSAPPNTQVKAVLVGSLDWAGQAPAQVVPTATGVAAVTSPTPAGLIFGPLASLTGNPVNAVVPLPPGTRTLVVTISQSPATGTPQLEVVGATSGISYYGKEPYLGNGTTEWAAVIPVSPAVDSVVDITIPGQAGAVNTLTVFGDTAAYTESEYYNGGIITPASQAGVGSGTLLTGPARLLTAACSTATASSSAVLQLNGTSILVAQLGATAGADSAELTFPDDFLLQASDSIGYVITTGGRVEITSTYP